MPSMEQAFKDKSTRPKIKYFNKKYFPAAVKPHDSLPGQAAGCQPCRQLDVLSQTPFPPSGQLHWREHGQPPQGSYNPTELVIRSSAPAQYGSLWSPPSPLMGPPWPPPIQLLGVLQAVQPPDLWASQLPSLLHCQQTHHKYQCLLSSLWDKLGSCLKHAELYGPPQPAPA